LMTSSSTTTACARTRPSGAEPLSRPSELARRRYLPVARLRCLRTAGSARTRSTTANDAALQEQALPRRRWPTAQRTPGTDPGG
jgi:hypothetical protein